MRIAIVVGLLLLTACAPEESDFTGGYSAPPNGSVNQALAQCRAQSDQMAAGAMQPGANVLLGAAMQSQYIQDCMRAKGYEMR